MRKKLTTKIFKVLATSKKGDFAAIEKLWAKFNNEFPETFGDLKEVVHKFTDVKEQNSGKFSQDYRDALKLEFLIEKHYSEIEEKIDEIIRLKKAANLHIVNKPIQMKLFDQYSLPPQHPDFPDDFSGDRYGGGGYDNWYSTKKP